MVSGESTDSVLCSFDAVTHVGLIEMNRAPHNFFDIDTLSDVADRIDFLIEHHCRAIVLCSAGKNFCAGADFSGREGVSTSSTVHIYDIAARIFLSHVPIVAAVQGAAIGGGLGLAMAADFRVGSPSTRLAANFAQLGFHQGFGLSVTLPRVAGEQTAAELLLTGRRISGIDGHRFGILDYLVDDAHVRQRALELAEEIASSAPLAVQAIRRTLRSDLAERAIEAMKHERVEQERLQQTQDFREGVRAVSERRSPKFHGA